MFKEQGSNNTGEANY